MPLGARLPFALRRPFLLLAGIRAARRAPPLARLERLTCPESFVWGILPYSARTFAACMAMLPAPRARASAVAYLYCRILDTFEDLAPTAANKVEALRAFSARFATNPPARDLPEWNPLALPAAVTAEDAANLLLVRHVDRIDRVFASLSESERARIGVLVRDMSAAMVQSAGWFDEQGGALTTADQLSEYCFGVLGHPLLFSLWLHERAHRTEDPIPLHIARDSAEFLQLANVTRDLEADLRRGIAYHPLLAPLLRQDAGASSEVRAATQQVRTQLLRRALGLAPAYRRLVQGLQFPHFSLDRAAAVLMMLFTARYWEGCAVRVQVMPACPRVATLRLLLIAARAAWSPRRAARDMELAELRLVSLREALPRESGATILAP